MRLLFRPSVRRFPEVFSLFCLIKCSRGCRRRRRQTSVGPKMEALRALVAERLTAAAEEISEEMLRSPEKSPEQQRAVIHKHLLVVADEIFRILEMMIGGCEAEVSRCFQVKERQDKLLNITLENETRSHQTDKMPLSGSDCEKNVSAQQPKCEQSRSRSPLQKGSDPPHNKDTITETDSASGRSSQFHRIQRAELGTAAVRETELEEEHKILSLKSSKGGSEAKHSDEDVNEELVKSSRRTDWTENQRADVCKRSGRSFRKHAAGKNMKNNPETTQKSQNTGRSRCRVCGKFFRYKRSFLKHALTHKKGADACRVCGKHLEPKERLKLHLKSHSEENKQTGKESEVECSDAKSESDEDSRKSDEEESKEGSCLQTPVAKSERSNRRHLATEERLRSHLSRTAGKSLCRVCGKFFRYKRSFLKHVLQHEQSADVCGVCGQHLDSDESLKVHLKTHSEENSCRDQTDMCSEGESDEDWKKSEGGDKEDIEQKLKNPKGLKSRALAHLKYCCKVCGKSFCYRASFLKHVQEDERGADLCGVCGKHFETEESLTLHLQTYIRTNDCEVCGKRFDGHKQLEMHMRTHTGEKPFVCAVCGKAFAQNGNLMGHMRVHTGEKPYACSVCGQSFSFKEYMTAHVRIHTGEKPFLCSVCGKGFRQRGTLKTHMMIHTGESTHRCAICDKKFYKSGALKIHMRSHTGEKPYLCNVCGKSFTAGGSLTKHMGVHEGERTHSCSTCGKTFPRKDELKRHVETHGDESI